MSDLDLTKSILTALDRALARDPDNAELKWQRAEHVREFGDVGNEIEEIEKRIAECEQAMQKPNADRRLINEHRRLEDALLVAQRRVRPKK